MRCLGHAPPLRAFVVVAWLLVIFPASSPGQSRHFHGAPGVASRSAEVDWTGLRAAEDGGGHLRSGARPRPRRPRSWGTSPEAVAEPLAALEMGPTLASPPPASSFAALGDNGRVIPPDTFGAVGPMHLVVTLNSQVLIQTRMGTSLSTVQLSTFWQSLGGPEPFDPRVLYDPFEERWVVTSGGDPELPSSSLLIAVSKTSDPTQGWFLNRIDIDSGNQVWVDHPTTGFNSKWVVIQGNLFSIAGGNFRGTRIYAFDKSMLYAGANAPHTAFTRNDINADQLPAVTQDNSLPDLYLISSWDGNASGRGLLRIFKISGEVGAETLTLGPFVQSSLPWAPGTQGFVDFAPQKDSAQRISTGDDAISNLVYKNGSLWTTQTIFLPSSASPTRSAIQWWQITPEGTIQQMGRIDDATGGSFFAYPSIAVNKNLDVLLGYSRFSASEFASAAYSFRAGTDPAGTLRGEVLLKAGEAPYFKADGENSNRWGDYSNTVVDPANDEDFWTIQEYAAPPVAGVDRWGTWWGRIVPPAPETSFVRGDVGGDGSLNLADAIAVLSYLFRGGSLGCLKSADADGNGTIDLTDPIYMLHYLFLGGPALPSPFPGCGAEAGATSLDCKSYPGCG